MNQGGGARHIHVHCGPMSSLRTRLAAGAAALLVAAPAGVSISSPARAAGPNLELSYSSSGNVDNSGELVGVYAYNWGDEPASDVTATFDASGLRDVTIDVPEWLDNCELEGKVATCHLPVLAAGLTQFFYGFELRSAQQSQPGPAGTLKGTIRGFGADGTEYTGGGSLDVTIIESGPDLVAYAEDINTPGDRVGPGDIRPLTAAIYNDGDTPASEWYIQVWVPTGAGIVEQYSDCEYIDWWPGEHPDGYIYGPNVVTCPAPPDLPLGAGEGIIFVDEEGESLFHVAFGKSLAGPTETSGSVQVGLVEDLEGERAPRRMTRKGQSGKTFADAVAGLKPTTRAAARSGEANTSNNWVSYSVWTKANHYDFGVTVEPVSGKIGDTVEIPYTVVNHGPADSGASWTFKAPSGTVLVDSGNDGSPWCYFYNDEGQQVEELPEVTCSNESEFPSKASGYQGVKAKIKLRIVSTPGDDGTLRVRPHELGTDNNPANDVAKLVVTVPSSGGGGGGTLPVTGASTMIVVAVGGGVLVIGAVLFFVARRRKVVTAVE